MALIPFYRPDFSRVIMNLDGPLQGRVEKTGELPPPPETAPLPLPESQPAPDIDPIPPPTDYPPTSSPEHSSPPRGTLHGNVMESIGQVVGAALQAVLGGSIGSANDILLPSNGVLPNDFLSELDEVPTPPIGNGYPRRQPFSNNIQPNLVNNFRLASNVTPVELPEGIPQNFSGEGLAGVIANNAVFQHQEDHPAPVWDFQAIDQRSQTLPVQNQAQQRDNFIQAQPSLHRHVPMSQGAIPVSFRSAAQQRINEINQSIRGRLDEMTAQRQHQEMLEAIRANANYRDGSRRGNAFNDVQRGEPLTPKAQQALAHATMVADAAAKKAAADQQKQREFARLKQQHFKALEASKIGLQVNELVDEHGSPIQTTEHLPAATLNEPLSLNNRTKDGYVVLGKQAYGSKEAARILSNTKGKYPTPLPYPTSPNLPKSQYPDVTKRVNRLLKQIERELNPIQDSWPETYLWFAQHFGNNKKWDLQVNHGLPGQSPVIWKNRYIRDNNGFIRTQDQYAVFNEKVVRAGYISNYAFGYAMASANRYKIETVVDAQIIALLKIRDGDNPADLQAIMEGWDDYFNH